MRVLVLVGQENERDPMKRLLKLAGITDFLFACCFESCDSKPSIKDIRVARHLFKSAIEIYRPDKIVAVGETAARMALDTSAVNINKLRGRDFEYVKETRKPGKKASNHMEVL